MSKSTLLDPILASPDLTDFLPDLSGFSSEISPNHFRVAIFGSARIHANDPYYNQIYRLARMIAAEGMDVVTGGGPGIMQAANKGHKEGRKKNGDTHSIGLNISLPYEQEANPHLDIKREFKYFSKRLDYFMHLSNVVVVAPGGIGTLLELFYTWQLTQVEHTCNTPIILLGNMWEPLMQWVEEHLLKKKLISPQDMNPIFVAHHCRETMKIIKRAHKDFKENPDYCWNFKKYRLEE